MSSKSELNALISAIVTLAKMKAVGNPIYIHEIKTQSNTKLGKYGYSVV